MWKDFFYYTRKQRISVVILILLLVFVFILSLLSAEYTSRQIKSSEVDSTFISMCLAFEATLHKRVIDNPKRVNYVGSSIPFELFYFDPNRADSIDLVRLGIKPYVARNIIQYRIKGGVFRDAARLSIIYGMDSLTFERVEPYVRIDSSDLSRVAGLHNGVWQNRRMDTNAKQAEDGVVDEPKQWVQKFTELQILELNSVDSTELRRVPGIGVYYAHRIIQYRQQLGGYYEVSQLKEIEEINDSLFLQLEGWFTVDHQKIERLKVNKLRVSQLRRHPYLNFYQAKLIDDLKRQRKKIVAIDELRLLDEFSMFDLQRLAPYLDFD